MRNPRRPIELACLLAGLCCAALCRGEAPGADTETVRASARELWRASISAPSEGQAGDDLAKVAEQVETISAAAVRPKPAPARPAATTMPSEGDDIAPASPAGPETSAAPAIDPNTLEKLKLAPAAGPGGKVALADSLFAQDQLDGACRLYQQALVEDKAGRDKDWVLFQVGNCLRAKDPSAARAAYKRVTAECPASEWAELASIECDLLDHAQTPASAPAARQGVEGKRAAKGAAAVTAARTNGR